MDLISETKLRNIAAEKGYNLIYLEKDYFLSVLLYCLKDLDGMYFKGGTALNKVFLEHTRLSEDLDFSATIPISRIKLAVETIVRKNKEHFRKIEYENEGRDFARIKVFYKGYFTKSSYVIIDVNKKASIHLEGERRPVHNFYNLDFEVNLLNFSELVAEKLRAAITRNKPRDYFDLYFILKEHPIDLELVKKKTEEAGERYDIERIFKNANKIYSKWDEDIGKLTNEKLGYFECIKFLEKKLRV